MTLAETTPTRLTRRPEEVAPMLGVSRAAVYQLVKDGKLGSFQVGRKILIPLSAVDTFLQTATSGAN